MDDGEPVAHRPRGTFAEPFSVDGVHLLRTAQQIQYQLSQMADQKASMLLGITFVIFTIALGQSRTGAPTPPVMMLGGAAFVAAFLTVLAVLPSVKPPGPKSDHDNILFFGAFARLSEREYIDIMLGHLSEDRRVYEVFARDIYQHGRVLAGKKYLLLGYAYRVLLTGLVASAVTFVVPLVIHAIGL